MSERESDEPVHDETMAEGQSTAEQAEGGEDGIDLSRAQLLARVSALEEAIGLNPDQRVRRLIALEKQVRGLNTTVEALRAENERLRLENEQLTVDLEPVLKEKVEERLLPATAAIEERLKAAEGQRDEFALALQTAQVEREQFVMTIDRLEEQRDERDDMLRKEEVMRRNAELQAKQAQLAAAKFRMKFLRDSDPTRGGIETKDPGYQARTRVLAWLGNWAARAELNLDDNVCALCKASPACYVDPRLPNPHGTFLAPEVMEYVRTLVAEAQARGVNASNAIEAWANGGSLLDGPAPTGTAEPVTAEGKAAK